VYDGHGALGDKVSQMVCQTVTEKVSKALGASPPDADPTAFLKEAFESTDDMLKKDKSIDAELSGTTAVAMVYRLYKDNKSTAWVAWVGDSRAVWSGKATNLVGKAKDLSHDHKPDTEKEEQRIKKAGGFVSPPEVEWGGPARVWLDKEMTLPGLAMARSIGDHLVKSVGVIAKPDVEKYEFDEDEDGFIVLASDGVWEFIESQKAIDLCNKFLPKGATEAVTKLIETSAAKWRQEEGDYRDDITAILLRTGKRLFE